MMVKKSKNQKSKNEKMKKLRKYLIKLEKELDQILEQAVTICLIPSIFILTPVFIWLVLKKLFYKTLSLI